MGSYIFKPSAVFSKNSGGHNLGTIAGGTPASDANLVFAAGNATGSDEFFWDTGGAGNLGDANILFTGSFYLDGSSTPLGVNNLPAGFNVGSCSFNAECGVQWSTLTSQFHVFATFASGLEVESTYPASFIWSTTVLPNPNPVLIDGFLKWRINKFASAGTPGFFHWYLEGPYTIAASSSVNTPLVNGGKVDITAPSGLTPFTDIKVYDASGVLLQDIPSGSYTIFTDTHIQFVLSSGGYSGAVTFTGSAAFLGASTIILQDPSGIYQIIPGQTHDTLYQDHVTTTQNVAIPTPFIKTGFIDGQ